MSVYTAEPKIGMTFEIIPIGRDPLVALFNAHGGHIQQLRLNGVHIGPRDYAFLENGANVIEVTAEGPGGIASEAYAVVNDVVAGYSMSIVNI